MSDEDFGANGGVARDRRNQRFSWTPAFEATFFRSLCESVQLGLRDNHTFKAEAWDRALEALRDQHGAYPTKNHLSNKSDNARKKFRLWRGLREHPDFLYNPVTRTVTASDESWKAHIEKEPLSRALRGRAFEYEDYMEILYPDVIGSGGAPKRIMRTKRKGPDTLPGEDLEMPGAGVLDLQVEQAYRAPQPVPTPQRVRNQAAAPRPVAAPRPNSTVIPPRASITNTSALTPPEETVTQPRKRFAPNAANTTNQRGPTSMAVTAQGKRRRISGQSAVVAVTQVAPNAQASSSSQVIPSPLTAPTSTNAQAALATRGGATRDSEAAFELIGRQVIEGGLGTLIDALKAKTPPRWPELAVEIFFRDFADEDNDLQLKIAEKALGDETKAMVFCKMTPDLRKHWVKRLKEMLNRVA